MTFQDFVKLHPNIIHYDRVGIEGIDFDALHIKIEKSRYLKSRRSFIYLTKNYKSIIAGDYDDFKLDVEDAEEERCKREEFIINAKLKKAVKEVESVAFTEKELAEFKYETGMYPTDVIEKIKGAISNKSEYFKREAEEAYKRFKEFTDEKNCVAN